MELNSHKPGVLRNLDNFNKTLVRRKSCNGQNVFLQDSSVAVVELPAMTVTLINKLIAVNSADKRILSKLAGISPRRIVPPFSVISFCSSIISITLFSPSGTNSEKDVILKYFLKTESSERSFAINDALYNYLKALKVEQEVMIRETNAYKNFLCVNAVGTLITPDSITNHFTKLLDENGLPHIKFHALRHSCISLLANNTAFTMKQIQDYAGHGDFLTTFNVYSHTDDSDKKTEMDYITSCFTDLFGGSGDE